MRAQNSSHIQSQHRPATYGMMGAILRLWKRLFFPGLRLHNGEKLQQYGPDLLFVTHPSSLRVALLLVSALDHPVHCLIPRERIRGILARLAAWALGMTVFDSLPKDQEPLLDSCLNVLANRGTIALFAEPFSQVGAARSELADFAAVLALEAILDGQGQVKPALYPVHWFLRSGRRRSERFMYVEGPILAHHFLPKVGEDPAKASLQLAETIHKAVVTNTFGLADPELQNFSFEMEDFSRDYLRQQWSKKVDWKQQPEELHLSSVAGKWIDRLNRIDPARLVEFRELLETHREGQRRFSLRQLIVDSSGSWQVSRLHVAAAWLEAIVGLPVALYGLVNHLPEWIILSATGYLKSSPQRDPKAEWLARIFAVLSFYSIQVFLVNHWWSRAAAGYYALTLPVSGLYLWRYRWLLRHRARVLILKALQPLRAARLARKRDEILARLDLEFERFVQPPVTAYGKSPDLTE